MDFENIFENVYGDVSRRRSIDKESLVLKDSGNLKLESTGNDGENHQMLMANGLQEVFQLQSQIRPIFGKDGINETPIGTHPDFLSLEGSDQLVNQYSCTMFVDIKGSTRLSLLYDLEEVFLFKNAVIQTCVEVVRAFDGYVHRLMGDAVMSFFGSTHKAKEDAVADAINCVSTLCVMLEYGIKPWMETNGFEAKDFGFRVGLDFGDDNEVLWGLFGYDGVGEISATGLPIDMASKLQGLARKNRAMLGQGLLEFVEWPSCYSKVKTAIKNETEVEKLFVEPNITDKDGNSLNYVMRELDHSQYMEVSVLPTDVRSKVNSNIKNHPEIKYQCFVLTPEGEEEYISSTKFLESNQNLEFRVTALTTGSLKFPLKVKLTKTNNGKYAPEAERNKPRVVSNNLKIIKRTKTPYTKEYNSSETIIREETTLYRGLHTMKCEISDDNGVLIFTDWIGVMIK
ncbi:adenylate/guanylate cyclase domain-containing protein [Vibrio parahaemolyticus]|uniref:nucleotide-binding domain-containing protein n=1 Tax=Vibrio parahaemolyticus TaxID=670 RepID=UPI0006A5ED8D|nr:adenylate/guanylate cyclase domain-containing protein [Vibrio parahaemolyticus]EHK0041051.1 adenylate/guanylate cyclase domain-containing protein [Vibrio parahaemolyticus]KOE93529.1 hypothetical protein ACS88_18435 [Vibrio parahaemolyticus]